VDAGGLRKKRSAARQRKCTHHACTIYIRGEKFTAGMSLACKTPPMNRSDQIDFKEAQAAAGELGIALERHSGHSLCVYRDRSLIPQLNRPLEEILTMMLKTLTAATAAALLALSSVALAQSSGSASGSTGASGTTSGSGVSGGASAGGSASGSADTSIDVNNKCRDLLGEPREQCLRDLRSGAGAGATTGGSTSGSMGGSTTTAPIPPVAPVSPTAPATPGSSSGGTTK
jgi:hypothetical protein